MNVACVGSRDITDEMRKNLIEIGKFIAFKGWNVVSGNALGADSAYAEGANQVDESRVWLHLPWKSYNKELIQPGNILRDYRAEWSEIASRHHPIYDTLTFGAKKMMDRNAGIMIDSDVALAVLNHSRVGWGGTWHGWNVAGELGKPRFDLTKMKSLEEVFGFLEGVEESKKTT